jgi:hypothetical protein
MTKKDFQPNFCSSCCGFTGLLSLPPRIYWFVIAADFLQQLPRINRFELDTLLKKRFPFRA